MNQLDIARINETAPYEVFKSERFNYYGFITDASVLLYVGFDEDDLLTSPSYQLVLLNGNNRPSPLDPNVRQTIIEIIREFFRVNNATMLYICETADGKQAMRNRLFRHWFDIFAKKEAFVLLDSKIIDREGVTNYIAIITRKDNPYFNNVIDDFTSAIKFFGEKPEG